MTQVYFVDGQGYTPIIKVRLEELQARGAQAKGPKTEGPGLDAKDLAFEALKFAHKKLF